MKNESMEDDLAGSKRKLKNKGEGKSSKQPRIDEIYEVENEFLDVINKDEKNEKLWNEVKDLKIRKDKWYKEVENVSELYDS